MMRTERCHDVADLRRAAQRRLPSPLFHYIDGGADDEWSLRRNSQAFDDYELQARVLADVSRVDLSTRVLGCDLSSPLILSPTGMNRLFHHHKELAVAQAADKFGCLYSLSTMATTSLEEVARASGGPKMFQVYIHKDRGLTQELVERCKAAGYQALCLTVDTPLAGNRQRDKRSGMVMPPKLSLRSLLSFITHPYWSIHYLLNPDFRLANVIDRVDALGGGAMSLIDYVNSQFDRSVSWDDLAWLIELWDGPFVIKGIQNTADAVRAAEAGASALMVSNHGGRQLDGATAPIDLIAPIREQLGYALELICDGGIRRGTHVLKALSLGANAVSIGRPYLYGLAAYGQAGVERALQLLSEEMERDMALLGCTRLEDLGPHFIHAGRGGLREQSR